MPKTPAQPRKPRGFAALTPERRREIASLGGRAALAKGSLHRFTPDQYRRGAASGGHAVARDVRHMEAIGRRGGLASAARRTAAAV